jgi:hypothetical protein
VDKRVSILIREGACKDRTLEPTTGLEPVTCRLRIDPALRKLLCNGTHFGAFRGVSGISGAICTAVVQQKNGRLRSRSGVVTSLDGRVGGTLRPLLRRLSAVKMTSGRARQFRAGWADFDSSMFPCSSRDAACGSGLDPEKRHSPDG